ncbi:MULTISPECIES: fimbrial protein [unclassified Caballeronia]|uniref:fimbrial protein n=1 Tax=unclassified Caballeronia TaxID=2646786 RepID=UPI002864D4F6|nr:MULTISPECIES: fimbrial protein [unclassified Caballeronia]MDR5749518.1 fimbrial protein [Caballeronia sp. LZ024]MDR5843352.1 fimbrial protein [Caballeronia sp. LZ031]
MLIVFGAKGAMARYNDCSGPLPATLNLPSVSVPSSLAIGQTVPGAISRLNIPLTCAGTNVPAASVWTLATNSTPTLVAGFTDVYTVPAMQAGIGFRIRGSDGTPVIATSNNFTVGSAANGANTIQFSIELVRTASTIVAGSVSFTAGLSVSNWEWANGGTGALSQVNFAYTMQTATVGSCSVTQTAVAVTLPAVSARSLATVGAVSGSAPFGLGLNCESGAKPQISMTDATTSTNQSTDLTLAPGSSAVGVGVQVVYGNAPVVFAPTPSYSTGGTSTSNMVKLGARSGVVSVPFYARYVRNGPTLTTGTVKALAVFTMAYQ